MFLERYLAQDMPRSIGPGHKRSSTLGCLGLPSGDDVLSGNKMMKILCFLSKAIIHT